jgi:hypothetical protein
MDTQRKPGRPKTVGSVGNPRKVSVWLTDKQFTNLKKRAQRTGVSVSEILRQAAA